MSTPSPDLSSLRAAFCGRLLTDPADTAPFLTDWRKRWTGRALAVAQPDATDDVAAIVQAQGAARSTGRVNLIKRK